jgi:hypothetical protein
MTNPCRLYTTAYSIYSQLASILESVPPSATWGSASYLLWLLAGIPRDACDQPHAQGANRHCHCPRSLPQVSRAFRSISLQVSDERFYATRNHCTSRKYGWCSPPSPPHSTLSPFRLPPALRKRRGCSQGGFEVQNCTFNFSAIFKLSSGRNAHILMRIL